MKLRPRALAALACGLILALVIPASASARPVVSRLHVEAGGNALDAGAGYVNDTARMRTSTRQPECGGSGQVVSPRGPTALGVLDYAQEFNRRLRPLEVTDRFGFGLLVCGIGGQRAFSAERFWLGKVNRRSLTVAADQTRLRRGDRVLWYLVDSSTGQNTGQELVVETASRARPGESVGVRVLAYDDNGVATPAAGAQVSFGENAVTTDEEGRAIVTAGSEGRVSMRATRGNDIPSEPVSVCVNALLDRCPALRGIRLVGTNRSERLIGGSGGDTAIGRRGNDVISIRGGDIDRADCGPGRDTVLMSRNDRADRDCERVLRR